MHIDNILPFSDKERRTFIKLVDKELEDVCRELQARIDRCPKGALRGALGRVLAGVRAEQRRVATGQTDLDQLALG